MKNILEYLENTASRLPDKMAVTDGEESCTFAELKSFSARIGHVLSEYISAGASGAIFGLFGSLLFFGTQYRATLDGIIKSPIMGVIVANLAIGFIIPGIDITAHIGGLIGGFIISRFLGVDGKTGNKSESINSLVFLALLIAFMCYMIFMYK